MTFGAFTSKLNVRRSAPSRAGGLGPAPGRRLTAPSPRDAPPYPWCNQTPQLSPILARVCAGRVANTLVVNARRPRVRHSDPLRTRKPRAGQFGEKSRTDAVTVNARLLNAAGVRTRCRKPIGYRGLGMERPHSFTAVEQRVRQTVTCSDQPRRLCWSICQIAGSLDEGAPLRTGGDSALDTVLGLAYMYSPAVSCACGVSHAGGHRIHPVDRKSLNDVIETRRVD